MDKSTENNESHKSMNGEIIDDDFEKQQDKSQRSGFLWTSLKFIGCVFLGIGLTVSHYVFNIVAAVPSTFFHIGLGIKNLYQMAKPKWTLQWFYFVFKSLFVIMYHLIKLSFFLIYRVTVGFFESGLMVVEPICCWLKGENSCDKINMRFDWFESKFSKFGGSRGSSRKGLVILHCVSFALGLGDFEIHVKKNGILALVTTKINNVIDRCIRRNLGRFAKWLLLQKDNKLDLDLNEDKTNSSLDISNKNKDKDNMMMYKAIFHPRLDDRNVESSF